MKVAVITDSGSNIYHQDVHMDGLYAVPLQIIDGEQVYLEGVNITIDATYQLIADGKLLKTSLPPIGQIEELFDQLKEAGYDLVFGVMISSGLSSTLSAVQTAAARIEMPFDYVDCFSTASNQLHLAMSARQLFDKQTPLDEVKRLLEAAVEDSVTFVVPEDLNHLARGGRITPLAAKLGGFLNIIPILKVAKDTGGKNDAFEKVRTMKKAYEVIINYFKEHKVDENCLICIAHVRNLEKGQQLFDLMREAFPDTEMFLTDLISTVGVHTGLNTVALQYIRKVPV
ncbi:MAG: DegV family protein [Erysipelothrix sp.]|nr:DegV family protein [Erysipelothrix sp.]